jgi:hypothetical protein
MTETRTAPAAWRYPVPPRVAALPEQLEDSLEGLRTLAGRLSAEAPDEQIAKAGARWLRPRSR